MNQTHVETGLRSILKRPKIFDFFNKKLLGTERYLKRYCDTYFNGLGDINFLDIGCGTADIINYLDQDIKYTGFDMQKEYIDHANAKYRDKGKFIVAKVDDSINSNWAKYFDVINVHGLLHHLSDNDCDLILSTSHKYLKDSGFMITVDSTYFKGQTKFAKWLVSKDRGQNVRSPDEYTNLAEKYFNRVEGKLIEKHLNIPYGIYTMVLKK